MGYDLVIGTSAMLRDSPVIAGVIEFEELTPLNRIAKHHRCWVFDRLLDFYQDQSFSIPELREAVDILDRTILAEVGKEERQLLYKLAAIFSMALRRNLPVHGVAD